MLETLIQFTACCRAWGLRVSTSEAIDCVKQLTLVNPASEIEFKTVVTANFVKSRRDQKRFEQVYQLFFHDIPFNDLQQSNTSAAQALESITADMKKELNHKDQVALIEYLGKHPAFFIQKITALHKKEERQNGPYKSNLEQLTLKLEMMRTISGFEKKAVAMVKQQNLDDQTREGLERYIINTLASARDLLTNDAGFYNENLKESKDSATQSTALTGKPFSVLTPFEKQQMKIIVHDLVRKLKDKVSRRQVVRNKGVLDVKKTLRLSGKFQGIPLEPRFKNKTRKKSHIVTLCDVSGSVWSTAGFMLYLLYSLQDCFSTVRSFVFVSRLAEVTHFFDNTSLDLAVEKALKKAEINYQAPTDYGSVLQQFKHGYKEILNKKTTLMILGDGRSNYQNPKADILSEFREKSRRIIWLNPEPANTWYTGDSEIRHYKEHCHSLHTCMNILHLEKMITDLIL